MIKFHDDKRFKITAFSELHILYADGSTEEA